MGAVTLARGRPLTVEDLEVLLDEQAWDDTNRYELIDGVLVVTPSPPIPHAFVVSNLMAVLLQSCPPDQKVLTAPLDVLSPNTAVQPDVLVALRSDLTEKYLYKAPLLAVEVLSPSNRLHDLNVKFARYERFGVPSYWVVDPETLQFVAWELQAGKYVEVADIGPGRTWTATRPFAVTIDPGTLRD